jgi:hypothetical protein
MQTICRDGLVELWEFALAGVCYCLSTEMPDSGNASCDALRILLEDKGFSRRDDVCTEVIEIGERI